MNYFSNIKVAHGITTRQGGVSEGVFGSMNTSFFGIDDKMAVFENIKRSLEAIGSTAKTIVATQQVHSNTILVIDEHTNFSEFKKIDVSESALIGYDLYVSPETDGLITNRNDVVLMTFYADCVPLLLHDPVTGCVGSIHSGWRGTANLIGQEAVSIFQRLGSVLMNIQVGIGHCAGVCCYEVDRPVIESFQTHFSEQEMSAFLVPKENEKAMLDLKIANATLFKRCGIDASNIEINQDCTICDAALYHSHRRTGYPRGSMSAFIQLNKKVVINR
jgi:hypothetical protein